LNKLCFNALKKKVSKLQTNKIQKMSFVPYSTGVSRLNALPASPTAFKISRSVIKPTHIPSSAMIKQPMFFSVNITPQRKRKKKICVFTKTKKGTVDFQEHEQKTEINICHLLLEL
jgi:hypothetical protein